MNRKFHVNTDDWDDVKDMLDTNYRMVLKSLPEGDELDIVVRPKAREMFIFHMGETPERYAERVVAGERKKVQPKYPRRSLSFLSHQK